MTRPFRYIATALTFTALAALLTACEPDVTYSTYRHIDAEGWGRADTLHFNTDTLRRDGTYGFSCGVRTRRSYPYQSLVVLVERNVYRRDSLMERKTEKVTFPIVTPHGRTLGEGVATKLHEVAIEEMELKAGDSLAVRVFHQMAGTRLEGITDVGIFMKKR